ncbi:MAG: response regulator transcription factor [Hyphomicrobiales bacterium]|nr:response regulator transcription factor [Hyphomicrobiales bacterium]
MKLLIVDDHPVVREGLAALLQQDSAETIVLEALNGGEGLSLVEQHTDLDLVLLDLALPDMDGFVAIAELGKRRPELPVIVLSSSEDPQDVRQAFAAGALGYVPKSASRQTLVSALQLVLSGSVYVPPLLLNEAPAATKDGAKGTAPTSELKLTERQLEVLRLISEGVSNKEIALRLGLAEKTVKVHVTGIFKTLNVVNRTQAAAAARLADLL